MLLTVHSKATIKNLWQLLVEYLTFVKHEVPKIKIELKFINGIKTEAEIPHSRI